MKRWVIAILGVLLFTECGEFSGSLSRGWVGDIIVDPELDDPAFSVCDEHDIYQYHNFSNGFQYQGEKYALEQKIRSGYATIKAAGETGLVRIRFVVNCQGESGRFRIMGMDDNYNPKVFDRAILDQLLGITKALDGWKIQRENGAPKDYYQYLIFKLKDGELQEILP